MKRIYAFFISFILTFCIMLCMFAGLYWIVSREIHAAEVKQQGVPVATIQPKNSKTTLCVVKTDEEEYYFLIKLNAIQNKVSVVALPQGFYMDGADRTLAESMDYAGVRQCVQDLTEHFAIKISYHFVCDLNTADKLAEGFRQAEGGGITIPQKFENCFKGGGITSAKIAAAMAISDAGEEDTAFIGAAVAELVKANMDNIGLYMSQAVKENYSALNTDIGTIELAQLEEIVKFLCNESTEYGFVAVKQEQNPQQAVEKELNG